MPRHEGFIKAIQQSPMLALIAPKLEWYFDMKGRLLYTKAARLKEDRGVWVKTKKEV